MNPVERVDSYPELLLPQVAPVEPDLATQKVLEIEGLLAEALANFQGLRDRFVEQTATEIQLATAQELVASQQQRIKVLEYQLAEKQAQIAAENARYIERSAQFQQLFQNFESIVRSLRTQIAQLQSRRIARSSGETIDRQLALVTQPARQISNLYTDVEADRHEQNRSPNLRQLPNELSALNKDLEHLQQEINVHSIQVHGFSDRLFPMPTNRKNPTANLEIKSYEPAAEQIDLDLPKF
jgi:predicted  nucleic acid-binding Zn-ribbon protein